MKRRITLIVILVLFLIPVAYFSYKGYQEFQEARRQRILFEKRKTAWLALKQTLENEISQFNGETGVVYTAKGKFLICVLTKNANNSKSAKEFISEVALDTYNYFQQF